jgi:hypothetical protein
MPGGSNSFVGALLNLLRPAVFLKKMVGDDQCLDGFSRMIGIPQIEPKSKGKTAQRSPIRRAKGFAFGAGWKGPKAAVQAIKDAAKSFEK